MRGEETFGRHEDPGFEKATLQITQCSIESCQKIEVCGYDGLLPLKDYVGNDASPVSSDAEVILGESVFMVVPQTLIKNLSFFLRNRWIVHALVQK